MLTKNISLARMSLHLCLERFFEILSTLKSPNGL